jgi:hypothetical protein
MNRTQHKVKDKLQAGTEGKAQSCREVNKQTKSKVYALAARQQIINKSPLPKAGAFPWKLPW